MNIALSPQTQQLLEEQLKSGNFPSPDALVRAALETLGQVLHLDEETLADIDCAEDQIEAGNVHEWRDVRGQLRSEFNKK